MLSIQWHITEQCNWRCTHCYHDDYLDKWPSLEKLKEIFHQIMWIKSNFYTNINNRQINIAWWEPFLRPDFMELLEYINANVSEKITIWILTNGSFFTDDLMQSLVKLENIFFKIQISIEGPKKVNDNIRWVWSYDKIINAIELCKKYGFMIHLSFTLTKLNKNHVFELLPIIKKYSVTVRVRRLVPMWQTKQEFELMLDTIEWYKFSIKVFNTNQILEKQWYKSRIWLRWCSELTGYKYDWFWCAVNLHNVVIILHNLDIYSCRRLPIVLWNLETDSLENIFKWDEYRKQIESSNKIEICKQCPKNNWCKWWAKCISYAKYNTLEKVDPQCYYAKLLKEKELKK